MTASESEKVDDASVVPETQDERPFVEDDSKKTFIPYDKGGLPFYIAIFWVLFIVAYVTVMSLVALPDLKAWLAH